MPQIPQSPDPADYVMPFGKWKGLTLDEIAETSDGLRWLDWAAGEFDVTSEAGQQIRSFVANPAIVREIIEAIAEQRKNQRQDVDGWEPKDWSWLKKRQ